MIAVSIISHNHGKMVSDLLVQLIEQDKITKIILTKNKPENLFIPSSKKIEVIENNFPKGFGENHNIAFSYINEIFFCVINPDIELINDPFSLLLDILNKFNLDLVAPIVVNKDNKIEDSARYFPTFKNLIKKLIFNDLGIHKIEMKEEISYPEWVAGMFMLFRSTSFKKIKGFDSRFFLYYEDVDICIRLWKKNMKLAICPLVFVKHDARRTSRKLLKYTLIHIASMALYFLKHYGRHPKIR